MRSSYTLSTTLDGVYICSSRTESANGVALAQT